MRAPKRRSSAGRGDERGRRRTPGPPERGRCGARLGSAAAGASAGAAAGAAARPRCWESGLRALGALGVVKVLVTESGKVSAALDTHPCWIFPD